MNEKNLLENRDIVILLTFPVALIAKLIQHLFLPPHFFYDSNRMLNTMLNADYEEAWGGTYEFVANIFRSINLFDIKTLLGWSIELAIIFNILILLLYAKNWNAMDVSKSLFALMYIAVLNIYAFNISKEIVQFVFFMIIVAITQMDRLPISSRAIMAALIFFWESTFFRSYYIIMAALMIAIYFLLILLKKSISKMTIFKFLSIFILMYVIVFGFFFLASVIMPDSYYEMTIAREMSIGTNANSAIVDNIEHNGNLVLFCANYFINSIRMMFPVELLKGGVYYAPFIAFQILQMIIVFRYIYNLKNIHCKHIIALSAWMSFFFGSVIFEPDFGSFIRHETATFPVIQLLMFRNFSVNNKSV